MEGCPISSCSLFASLELLRYCRSAIYRGSCMDFFSFFPCTPCCGFFYFLRIVSWGYRLTSILLRCGGIFHMYRKIHIRKDAKKEGIYSCSTVHDKKTINFTIYQCTWCLSMEHHFKNCKCPEEKLKNGICQDERISHPSCNKCLIIHKGSRHPKDDKTPPKCLNCRGNHQATDIRCPKIYEKAEEILKIRLEKMKENKVKVCN